jgi:hypothetical protein
MNESDFTFGANRTERLPTLRDIAMPLFRHTRLMMVTFLAIVSAAILGVVLLPAGYQAKMKILVKRERMDAAVSPGRDAAMASPGDVTEEELNSEVELLKSRDLLEKVVLSCDLHKPTSGRFWDRIPPMAATAHRNGAQSTEMNISRAVAALEDQLHIEPLKKLISFWRHMIRQIRNSPQASCTHSGICTWKRPWRFTVLPGLLNFSRRNPSITSANYKRLKLSS